MSTPTVTLTIDGEKITARDGQTIMEAADDAGVYIPRLCAFPELPPHGSCRVCTVKANGRTCTACTQPVADGMTIENETDEIQQYRRDLVDMLFVEGNHFCMFCEKSGNCELQAVAYRLGITAPKYPYLFPKREVDASHPDIFLDHDRCILCGRCAAASRDLDHKHVFDFVNRGHEKRIAVNATARLADTELDVTDQCVNVCPVGAILTKRTGYAVPIGERKFDHEPIGSDVEKAKAPNE